jgi:lysophospholipase L1-like esterase
MQRIPPNHASLLYDQHVDLHLTHERATFSRCFDPKYGCDLPEYLNFGREWRFSPGARVTMLTDALRVSVILEFANACEETCAGTPPDHCYRPSSRCHDDNQIMCGACKNHCEPKLYVDGLFQPLRPTLPDGNVVGTRTFQLVDAPSAGATGGDESQPQHRERRLELVMPWGGEVHLLGFEVCCDEPSLRRPNASSAFRFLAYGDSITQGYCAGTPFPEVLGRLNGWESVNLGIGGMKVSPQHGESLGRMQSDLIMIFIGTNDWWGHCDVAGGIGQTLDGIRNIKPLLPIVVVTMLARSDEPAKNARRCIVLEDFREQISQEISNRQGNADSHLYLIEGRPLLSLERLGDGLHPGSSAAMAELAHNMNAQMGFSRVQLETVSCDSASGLHVRARGLTRNGVASIFWGNQLENSILPKPCHLRSTMVGGIGGSVGAVADDWGRVSFVVASVLCNSVHFQVVDATTCTTSRVGRRDAYLATGTPAENFMPPPQPPLSPPPQPSPQPPPWSPPALPPSPKPPRLPSKPRPLPLPPVLDGALPQPSPSSQQPSAPAPPRLPSPSTAVEPAHPRPWKPSHATITFGAAAFASVLVWLVTLFTSKQMSRTKSRQQYSPVTSTKLPREKKAKKKAKTKSSPTNRLSELDAQL